MAVFSRRIPAEFGSNRLTRALEAARKRGSIVDLTESNPTRAGFAADPTHLATLLAAPEAVRYDPDPRGWIGARRAVVEYYGRRGRIVDEDRIVLTSSTSEAYALLFKLLCNASDEVLVPAPSYPLFEFLASAECVIAAPYQLTFDGRRWGIELPELERALTSRSRAIVVVAPNNPTGSVLTADDLEAVMRLCRDNGLVLICDEVFADYPHDLPARFVPTPYDGEGAVVFTLNGLSKVAGLPQLKLGWIVASGDDRAICGVLTRLEFLSDLYLSVGTPIQRCLPALLDIAPSIQESIRGALSANLRTLRAAVADTALSVLPVEAGWTAVVRAPRIFDDETFALKLLEEESTLVQPGYFYDFEEDGYLVLSLLTPPAVFAEGVQRLEAFVVNLCKGS